VFFFRPTRRRIQSLEEENRCLRALARSHPGHDTRIQASSPLEPQPLGEPEAAEKTPEDGAINQYHGPTSAIFDLKRNQAIQDTNPDLKTRFTGPVLFAEAARQRKSEMESKMLDEKDVG